MGEEFTVTATHVKKNNGICLDGIIISRKEQKIAPAFYLNDQYQDHQNGKSLEDMAEEIVTLYYATSPQPDLNLDFFKSYQEMKDRVLFKLIHYHKNRELLREIPYKRFFDLAIVFYCGISDRFFENGTILIYNFHLKMWKVSLDELYSDAVKNTPEKYPPVIESMEDVVKGLFTHSLQEKWGNDVDVPGVVEQAFREGHKETMEANMKQSQDRYKMYVLSNSEKLFGAAVMLYPQVLERITGELKTNLYLLPSSVHEIILIPDDGQQDKAQLLEMVSEINDTQVDPEEVLAYAVYYFERKSGEIIIL